MASKDINMVSEDSSASKSSDEEPMEVDGGPSSPPTANTAGGAQVMEVLSGDGDAMDLDEPGPSTAPTNTAGVTLTKGLSPEREREEEEGNEGESQALVEGEGAVQNGDPQFDQPVWSENSTVQSERMRGHYPQEQQDVDPLATFFRALFLYLCRNNPNRLMELD